MEPVTIPDPPAHAPDACPTTPRAARGRSSRTPPSTPRGRPARSRSGCATSPIPGDVPAELTRRRAARARGRAAGRASASARRPRARRRSSAASTRSRPAPSRRPTGPLLILAGAGSGKTRVLAHRIAYLVGVKDVRPWPILAVTFTNRAAGELRERIISLVGERRPGRPGRHVPLALRAASCGATARRSGSAAGSSSTTPRTSRALMKQILREEDLPLTGEFRPSAVLGAISRAKNEMLDATFLAENAVNHRERTIARLAARYQERLREGRRARLRRPAARGRPPVRRGARRPGPLPGSLALPPRRRVPGHEPAAVPVDQGAGREAPQPRRRRRRRPVDLPLARRGHPEHPRLRARLAGRDGRQARAELPLDPADPRRRPRRRLAQHGADRQEALDRRTPAARRSSASRPTTRRRRPSGSPARSRAWSAAAARALTRRADDEDAARSGRATSR